VTERDRVCAATKSFEDAPANGAVSGGHLDALAETTRAMSQIPTSGDFAHHTGPHPER
jgi:hypothetical protein